MQVRRFALAMVAALALAPTDALGQGGPFVGEIRWVAFDFAPLGWAKCDGQILSISQNTPLFALLGTTYGGDGKTTFALPDFRSRMMVHVGQGPGLSSRVMGEQGGAESHTLAIAEMPAHSHGGGLHSHPIPSLAVNIGASSGPATGVSAAGNVLATAAPASGGNGNPNNQKVTAIYNGGPADVVLGGGSATVAGATDAASGGSIVEGGSQPHPKMPPFLTANCIIALQGVFPSRQ